MHWQQQLLLLLLWWLLQPRCGWVQVVAPLPCVPQQQQQQLRLAVAVAELLLPVAALVLLLGRTVRLAGL
jgi:hypothetical protein